MPGMLATGSSFPLSGRSSTAVLWRSSLLSAAREGQRLKKPVSRSVHRIRDRPFRFRRRSGPARCIRRPFELHWVEAEFAMNRLLLLRRMETARRQTKAHLDLIERQIAARAERMAISARAKARSHPRGRSRWTRSDDVLFREYLDQLSFERRGEIDALTRKLSRQERAIAAVRAKVTIEGSGTRADTQSAL